jgi:hypothetical protein
MGEWAGGGVNHADAWACQETLRMENGASGGGAPQAGAAAVDSEQAARSAANAVAL